MIFEIKNVDNGFKSDYYPDLDDKIEGTCIECGVPLTGSTKICDKCGCDNTNLEPVDDRR